MKAKKRQFIKQNLKMERCRYCRSTENLTIDHKIPQVKGGSDDLDNLQCLCNQCNAMKSQYLHGEIVGLWKWFVRINKSRRDKGVKEYLEKYKNSLSI